MVEVKEWFGDCIRSGLLPDQGQEAYLKWLFQFIAVKIGGIGGDGQAVGLLVGQVMDGLEAIDLVV